MNNDQPKVQSRFPVEFPPIVAGPSPENPIKIVERVAEVPLEDLTTKLNDDDFELMAQGEPAAKRQKPDVPLKDKTTKVNDDNFEATKQPDGGYSCNYCLKFIQNKTDMRRHIRTHKGEKLFDCSFCGKNFIRKADLNRHMQSIHK